uniref:Uncharacterized protein n=1 Tax=Catagonus wagneri TaxID=51154 RepID=A0A8C3VFB9_9CETA
MDLDMQVEAGTGSEDNCFGEAKHSATLDQSNSCLDHLKENNDHLHTCLQELLESNWQMHLEFQQQLRQAPGDASP